MIGLVVVRIIGYLADSSTFSVTDQFRDVYKTRMNRLAGLIDASDETYRVMDGFARRLRGDAAFENSFYGGDQLGDNAGDESMDDIIKAAILDLLMVNTQPHRLAPNLAHLLLGCDIKRRAEDLDIGHTNEALDSNSTTCLHVVLLYLSRIQAESTGGRTEEDIPNLLLETPILAEKCYRLIRQLCLHDFTSGAFTSYLRLSQDHFLQGSYILPLRIPTSTNPSGSVLYSDNSELRSTASAVTAVLHSQAWLLESLALELNNLVAKGMTERAIHLLDSLYGSHDVLNGDFGDLKPKSGLDQALPRMLDLFYSLDFSWSDSVPINGTPISFYASLPFDSCLRKQASGCEIYDVQAVLSLLHSARRGLQIQGALNSQQQQNTIKAETRAILENLVIENNRRDIQHARLHTLQAWRSVLDITLTQAFYLLPNAGSDILLLDLLSSVIPPVGAPDIDQSMQDVLAGAALVLMTQLRQEGLRLSLLTVFFLFFKRSFEPSYSLASPTLFVVICMLYYYNIFSTARLSPQNR